MFIYSSILFFVFSLIYVSIYSPDSEAIGVLASSIRGVACLDFSGHVGANPGCWLRVLLSEWCVLEGAVTGAAAGCRVPLKAAARCCLRVLLSEWCEAGKMPLQGGA